MGHHHAHALFLLTKRAYQMFCVQFIIYFYYTVLMSSPLLLLLPKQKENQSHTSTLSLSVEDPTLARSEVPVLAPDVYHLVPIL